MNERFVFWEPRSDKAYLGEQNETALVHHETNKQTNKQTSKHQEEGIKIGDAPAATAAAPAMTDVTAPEVPLAVAARCSAVLPGVWAFG